MHTGTFSHKNTHRLICSPSDLSTVQRLSTVEWMKWLRGKSFGLVLILHTLRSPYISFILLISSAVSKVGQIHFTLSDMVWSSQSLMEFIKYMHCISEDYSGFNAYSMSALLLSKADALHCSSENWEQFNSHFGTVRDWNWHQTLWIMSY